MTIRPVPGSTTNPTHLPVAQTGPPRQTQRPEASARFADPYPLGAAALTALRALIAAMCPPSPAPRSSELLARVELGTRRLLRYMHPFVARALSLGLLLLDFLPVLTLSSRLRFHRLDGGRATELVGRWGMSSFLGLRLLMKGARSLVLGVYFDQKEVHTALRYEPLPFIQERMRLRASLLRPVTAAAE